MVTSYSTTQDKVGVVAQLHCPGFGHLLHTAQDKVGVVAQLHCSGYGHLLQYNTG